MMLLIYITLESLSLSFFHLFYELNEASKGSEVQYVNNASRTYDIESISDHDIGHILIHLCLKSIFYIHHHDETENLLALTPPRQLINDLIFANAYFVLLFVLPAHKTNWFIACN